MLAYEFGCVTTDTLAIATSPAMVERHVGAFRPPELRKALLEYLYNMLPIQIAIIDCMQHADPTNALGALRRRSERPRRRTAECGYQFAPSDVDWHDAP
jgi:hypothetical protein